MIYRGDVRRNIAIRMCVDKEFKFAANTLRVHISMDGSRVASHSVVQKTGHAGDYEIVSQGCKSGVGRLHKYQFTILETSQFPLRRPMRQYCNHDRLINPAASDSHQLQNKANDFEDLGDIVVRVEHKKGSQRRTHAGQASLAQQPPRVWAIIQPACYRT